MESMTIFALCVALFGAVHIIFDAVEHFSKGINKTDNQRQKRADWYCFFKTSDLLGADSEKTETMNDRQSSQTEETQKIEQRRKQQANRPRLYV
jgi:hypothetical protein